MWGIIQGDGGNMNDGRGGKEGGACGALYNGIQGN